MESFSGAKHSDLIDYGLDFRWVTDIQSLSDGSNMAFMSETLLL